MYYIFLYNSYILISFSVKKGIEFKQLSGRTRKKYPGSVDSRAQLPKY